VQQAFPLLPALLAPLPYLFWAVHCWGPSHQVQCLQTARAELLLAWPQVQLLFRWHPSQMQAPRQQQLMQQQQQWQ
jgi:hypothetical protein